jgi:hypothetical protein
LFIQKEIVFTSKRKQMERRGKERFGTGRLLFQGKHSIHNNNELGAGRQQRRISGGVHDYQSGAAETEPPFHAACNPGDM